MRSHHHKSFRNFKSFVWGNQLPLTTSAKLGLYNQKLYFNAIVFGVVIQSPEPQVHDQYA